MTAHCHLLPLLLAVACVATAMAKLEHHYEDGDHVPLVANKIGPYANPSETYQYYTLPFCQPKDGKRYIIEGLGEVLEGDRLVSTPFDIRSVKLWSLLDFINKT